jgi:hypothetical protein
MVKIFFSPTLFSLLDKRILAKRKFYVWPEFPNKNKQEASFSLFELFDISHKNTLGLKMISATMTKSP